MNRTNIILPWCEVEDQMVEYLRMHVLAELHHDEPVSEPELGHDQADVFSSVGLRAATEHQEAGVAEDERC